MSERPAERFRRYWESLTPSAVARIGEHYTEDATFTDPFNDVRGLAAIGRIFGHMFETLEAPRFEVIAVIEGEGEAFFTWDFRFRLRKHQPGKAWRIHGATHVHFAADGRVERHRDYWDAAGEVYAKLPVVGSLVRWLGRRFA